MPCIHSSAIGDRRVVLVGLLLIAGLLVQSVSVQPCSRTVLDGAGTADTERVVPSSSLAACSAFTTTAVRQAVSPERSSPSVEGGLDGVLVKEWAVEQAVDVTPQDGARVRISSALQILRPVVLQI